jgi:endonuclease YncB( thermonuclease family)
MEMDFGQRVLEYYVLAAALVSRQLWHYIRGMVIWRLDKRGACALFLSLLCCCYPLAAREISSSAIVNEDGTLRISGKTIHLYGIHIPRTDKNCSRNKRPPFCGSRAAIALDFKISGFVRCEIMDSNSDGSLIGWCRVKASNFSEGEDLSAYLLEYGWAVALPDASIEYQTLEKIARSRGIGVWGIPVDNIIRRHE